MKKLLKSQMSQDQLDCYNLMADLVYGAHHLPANIYEFGFGIKVNISSSKMSTYDFDMLTRLVFLAHDRCVRAEILAGGPYKVGIALWKRHKREGSMMEKHPTLESAVQSWREKNPVPG